MHIGWPQGIILGLMLLADGMALAKHGEPKESDYNILASLAGTAIMVGLLYWGGFFK